MRSHAADPLLDDLKLASAFSETENGKRKTENGFLIRQLQKLFPDLDLTLADLPPRTEKSAKNYRKISEKSAKNTPGLPKNSQQNHQHTPSEKKLPKNPSVAGPEAAKLDEGLPPFWQVEAPYTFPAMTNESEIPSPANRKRSFT